MKPTDPQIATPMASNTLQVGSTTVQQPVGSHSGQPASLFSAIVPRVPFGHAPSFGLANSFNLFGYMLLTLFSGMYAPGILAQPTLFTLSTQLQGLNSTPPNAPQAWPMLLYSNQLLLIFSVGYVGRVLLRSLYVSDRGRCRHEPWPLRVHTERFAKPK